MALMPHVQFELTLAGRRMCSSVVPSIVASSCSKFNRFSDTKQQDSAVGHILTATDYGTTVEGVINSSAWLLPMGSKWSAGTFTNNSYSDDLED